MNLAQRSACGFGGAGRCCRLSIRRPPAVSDLLKRRCCTRQVFLCNEKKDWFRCKPIAWTKSDLPSPTWILPYIVMLTYTTPIFCILSRENQRKFPRELSNLPVPLRRDFWSWMILEAGRKEKKIVFLIRTSG